MKIDPNAPAFPFVEPSEPCGITPGLTIRAEIASRVLAGMASNLDNLAEAVTSEPALAELPIHKAASIAACAWADALLEALNQDQP